MGRQIIKQPNGKFCIFSSEIDNVTHCDLTADDIIEGWVNEAREDITKKVTDIVSKIESGGKPYYQFTTSYDEMLETVKEIHGESEYKKLKSAIEHDR